MEEETDGGPDFPGQGVGASGFGGVQDGVSRDGLRFELLPGDIDFPGQVDGGDMEGVAALGTGRIQRVVVERFGRLLGATERQQHGERE